MLFIFLWLIVSQLATKLSYRRRLDKVKTVMIMMTKVSQFATKLSYRLKDDQDIKIQNITPHPLHCKYICLKPTIRPYH